MKKHFFNKALRVLLSTNAMILLAAAMLGPIYALFVTEIGGDLMDASIAGGIFAFVAGLVTLISGKYSDRVKENELIVVLGYFIMGLGFLLYFWVSSIIFLFIVQAIIGLGEAIYSPAFDAVYSKHIDGHKSGTQWGVWESMNYFATAIGAVVGGGLATLFGFRALFIIMAILCFSSGLYIYRLKRSVL
ncbi:MAG: MFS transporter [Candidatus Magasanikbacteria bacterium]|nr:MFS transporter [Candidatus Magasanikbacteria bacterium]